MFGRMGARGGFGRLGVVGGGRIPGWIPNPNNPPDIAINWTTNQAWTPTGGLTTPAALGITTSRASVKQVVDSNGNWSQVAANTTAISNLGRSTEEARTNTLAWSSVLTATHWNTINISSLAAEPAPDGSTNAVNIISNTTNARHTLANPGITASAAVWTASVFMKAAGYNFGYVGLESPGGTTAHSIIVNLTTGVITATNDIGTPANAYSQVDVYPNGWIRITVGMTCVATASVTSIVFGPSPTGTPSTNSNAGEPQFAGDGVSGVLAWQPQLELGASVTSPIVTSGAAATRAEDVTRLTGLVGGSAISLFEQFTPQAPVAFGANQATLDFNDGSTTNRSVIIRNAGNGFAAAGGSGSVSAVAYNGSTSASLVLPQNTQAKVAGAFVPSATLTQLNFGSRADNGLPLNGLATIDAIWLTQAVPSAQLQAMTT